MSHDNTNPKIVGVPQAAAAGVGAVIIYISQSGALDEHTSQILIYFSPVVSAITGGVFSWMEDCLKDTFRNRKLKARYQQVINDGTELLKSEDLDSEARSHVAAAMNQARISYISRNLEAFHTDLGSMRKGVSEEVRPTNLPKRH